jgi:lipoate-protein ligase A
MRLIVSRSLCPYFHLAAEAFFLQQTNENILLIWQSESAVVSGKHQNICAEINYKFCKENNILPARRLSGGGTVFHDMGNINFTFIKNIETEMDKAVNYKQFLEPIRKTLSSLGIETTYSHRDDLLLDGKKISGNAQHIFQQKKRVLHHGTLLYNCQLTNLSNALHSEGQYEDKAVKSVRSVVTNIKDYHNFGETQDFLMKLINELSTSFGAAQFISDNDTIRIDQIKKEKFELEEWILGYSPKYIHRRLVSLNGKKCHLYMFVDKGEVIEMNLIDEQGENCFVSECLSCLSKPISVATFKKGFIEISETEIYQFL